MLRPECHGCAHLNRNQCEFDGAMPINMEIGSLVEYVTDPEKDRSCASFAERSPEDPTLV